MINFIIGFGVGFIASILLGLYLGYDPEMFDVDI